MNNGFKKLLYRINKKMTTYEKNKKHIYAYREKNPEKIKEITRRSMQKLRQRKRESEKIEKPFLNILFEENTLGKQKLI